MSGSWVDSKETDSSCQGAGPGSSDSENPERGGAGMGNPELSRACGACGQHHLARPERSASLQAGQQRGSELAGPLQERAQQGRGWS